VVQVIFAHAFRFLAELAVTANAAKPMPHAMFPGVGTAAQAALAAPPVAMSFVAALLNTKLQVAMPHSNCAAAADVLCTSASDATAALAVPPAIEKIADSTTTNRIRIERREQVDPMRPPVNGECSHRPGARRAKCVGVRAFRAS
jgi:hypothetical protein